MYFLCTMKKNFFLKLTFFIKLKGYFLCNYVPINLDYKLVYFKQTKQMTKTYLYVYQYADLLNY